MDREFGASNNQRALSDYRYTERLTMTAVLIQTIARQIVRAVVWAALIMSASEAASQQPTDDTSANSVFLGCKAFVDAYATLPRPSWRKRAFSHTSWTACSTTARPVWLGATDTTTGLRRRGTPWSGWRPCCGLSWNKCGGAPADQRRSPSYHQRGVTRQWMFEV